MAGYRYSRLIEPWLGVWPILALTAFALVETSQRLGFNIPWVHWYLNDLICMPILIAVSISLERLLTNKLTLLYDWKKVLFYLLVISLFFEVILPLRSSKYTADIIDVLCYIVSAGITYWFSPCIDRRMRMLRF